MKNKQFKTLIGITVFILLVYLLISVISINNSKKVTYDFEADYESVSQNERTICVAADSDYPPFTYFDETGKPTGHDIELIYALAREMNCNVDLVMTDWVSALSGMKDGSYDLLLSVNYSKDRLSSGFLYSAPILTDSYVFFGPDDGSGSIDCASSADLSIAALKDGSEIYTFLVPMGIGRVILPYSTTHEAFDSVVNGRNDLVISTHAVGKALVGLYGLPLVEKSERLHETNYYILYREEDAQLGEELNAALGTLRNDGTLDALRIKWVEEYKPGLTFKQFFIENSFSIIILLMGTFIVMFVVVSIIFRRMNLREKSLLETDQATGLYNIQSFHVHVNELLTACPREKFVILYYDIDRFKVFNDMYGTSAGDRMLRDTGRKLKSMSNEKFICGHGGGDNFMICRKMEDFSAKNCYNSFIEILSSTFPGYGFTARLGFCPIEFGDDPAQICDKALLAQRSVKGEYNRFWAGYSPEMMKNIIEDNIISGEVAKALQNGDFIPYFQPQYDYTTGEIIGAEVLMRWKHPDKGIILPWKFIPVLEKTGFIYELDKFAWRQACKALRKWKDEGLEVPPLSVNVSRRDIYQEDLVDTLISLTDEYNIKPADLRLELTESGYIENAQRLAATMKKLSEHGFYIEMDDFGSGYSSLSILKDLPFNLVKIDMSLVRESGQPGKSVSILTSIVQLSRQINIPVIAEGVETRSQAEFLKSIGCHYMQGFLFSQPVPFEAFDHLIRNGSNSRISEGENSGTTNIDPYSFFTQNSNETLLFNNYVGGAYIAEFCNNRVDVLRTNDKFFSTLGLSRESWLQMSSDLTSHFSWDSRKAYTDMLTSAILSAQEAQCEIRYDEFTDGKPLWVRTRAKCLANKDGSYIFYCEVENLTDQRILMARNEELLSELNSVIANIPIGIVRFRCSDDTLICEYANKVVQEKTGYSESEFFAIVNGNFTEQIHPEDAEAVGNCISEALASFSPIDVIFRIRCKDGDYICIHLIGRFITDKRGNFLYTYFIDIPYTDKQDIYSKKISLTV